MIRAQKIYIGGWFQRTTLHLSEIYDFLKDGASPLDLDKEKLKELRKAIGIIAVQVILGPLDYIDLKTEYGIHVKIFEDGLMVLSTRSKHTFDDDIDLLRNFYEKKLSPGISYIFSLGAPVPKELAQIKTIYPYFILFHKAHIQDIEEVLMHFHQQKYLDVRKKELEIYRGDKLYIINNISEDIETIESFVEEQIFIREFKGQLHRYLNLHRNIWEKIAEVKERGTIRGSEVGAFKERIESYEKTINFIEARINQMDTYVHTRQTLFKTSKKYDQLRDVLDFKHETLINTLEYIIDLWALTKSYVLSALNLFSAIQAKSTESSVKNLTVVTSIGVGATVLTLISQKVPEFKIANFVYVLILAAVGYGSEKIMRILAKRKMYKIHDAQLAKDI